MIFKPKQMDFHKKNQLIIEFISGDRLWMIECNYEYDLHSVPEMNDILASLKSEDPEYLYFPCEMKFHNSWDWLMLAVDKCYEYGELDNNYREGIIETFSGIINIDAT